MSESIADIFKNALLNTITSLQAQGLSESEISKRLNQDRITDSMQKIIGYATSDIFKSLTNTKYEIEHDTGIVRTSFLAHHNEIWSHCFTNSEVMYVLAVEAAEEFCEYVANNVTEDEQTKKQYTFLVLQYIHGRCCQEFLEILHLMKWGFADCAYARWRSMFELCCIAEFIRRQGETIAKQYYDKSQTDEHNYEWTTGAVNDKGKTITVKSFQTIMDNIKIDQSWKEQYEKSCLIVHGTPQGTFKRLCLKDEKQMVVVGQSDYGITTPAEHSAISLQWITAIFLSIFPNLDSIVHSGILEKWVEEIRTSYFSTADECFSD